MTGSPRIGLTMYRETTRWGVWEARADVLPATYADAVAAAGGAPVLLPPVDPALVDTVLDAVDGVVVTGGADVDPSRYGADAHPRTDAPRVDRDGWELAIVRAALQRDLPLLGVCRGLQVLNTALDGTLLQHLPDVVGTELHSPSPGIFSRHDVRLERGSRLAGFVGETATIATHHHQAVDRLGTGLVACGWADDGVVEAVELPGRAWVFGVQWHPEAHQGADLFGAFVSACATARP